MHHIYPLYLRALRVVPLNSPQSANSQAESPTDLTMNRPQRPTETSRPVLLSHGNPTPPAYHSCATCGNQIPQTDLKDMPSHMRLNEWPGWPFPTPFVLTLIFTSLCTISYGHKDLYHVWRTCNENGEDWMKRKERLAERISNVTVVVSRFEFEFLYHEYELLTPGPYSLMLLGCTSHQR